MRANYWSCSKFADWLRGIDKPQSETGKGWRDWNKLAKATHPWRYWLAEEGLDNLQNFIYWPFDKLYSIKYWINNRFITKTHTLTSSLKRGEWHEFDERLLYCMFDELVNFVEGELAWNHTLWDEEARKKYQAPWYAHGWFRWRTWRSSEAGLAYLDWASNLKKDENYLDKDDPEYGKPTQQALDAIEIRELYNWWKNIRPTRPDPYDESKWSQICDSRREKYSDMFWGECNEEEQLESSKSISIMDEVENRYYDEDTEMMIRLINLRRGLWT